LYIRFKLKVAKAKEMRLDTIPELITELEGYRKQLSKSYLVDKEVNDRLVVEVFERMQKDINVSHILITLNETNDPSLETTAEAKINHVYKRLQEGVPFEQLAVEHSEDPSSRNNGGSLGYVTSMLPDGFYEFENIAYSLKPEEYSKPFKTHVGYHIVKLNAERPARGEIEAAHIMILKKNDDLAYAKNKIDSIYQLLLKGEEFDKLAKIHSTDRKTALQGGYLGFFGINKYEMPFEEAAFALTKDGEFSKPFSTTAGWHIIKRISKVARNDFDKVKRGITAQVLNDGRYNIAKEKVIQNIQKENNFKENKEAFNEFIHQLDQEFFTADWVNPVKEPLTLFSLEKNSFTTDDFAVFCKTNQRDRIRYGGNTPIPMVAQQLYNQFVNETCLGWEEDKLESKYPDFKALMREYAEGILLFEATKREVWDKASQDVEGLTAFFEKNSKKYTWKQRADLYTYTIQLNDEAKANEIYAFAFNNNHEKLIEKFNKDNQLVIFTRSKVESGSNDLVYMKMEKGDISALNYDSSRGIYKFRKIEDILAKSPKSLDEAKGYVIADYQEFLEKAWVEKLRKEFKVEIEKTPFEKLIKK
ncbi:MAG TPA: peptidylprolyl isomerase, partial [Saprospiraceae bacterium]|nr:peptidylprolyl isomerase [Saprospiraceae bacterium]